MTTAFDLLNTLLKDPEFKEAWESINFDKLDDKLTLRKPTGRTLKEDTNGSTAVVCFGRFNPMTKAHKMMIDEFMPSLGGEVRAYTSHKCEPEKNPLDYDTKMKYLKIACGDKVIESQTATDMYKAIHENSGKYNNLIYVCGSDRINEANQLVLPKKGKAKKDGTPSLMEVKCDRYEIIDPETQRIKGYNVTYIDSTGTEVYHFDTLEVVPFGNARINIEEDIDITKISGTAARDAAKAGDLETFLQIVPFEGEIGKQLFDDVRAGMGITESLDEELLDESQADKAGTVYIAVNGEIKSYDAFKISSARYGLCMGNDRLYDNWKNAKVEEIKLELDNYSEVIDENHLSVYSKDGRHVKFGLLTSNNKLELDGKSGTGRSGKGFTDKEITAYQEVIMGLILSGEIDSDIAPILLNSIIYRNGNYEATGVFDLGVSHPTIDDKFYNNWQKFAKDWSSSLQIVLNDRDTFYNIIQNKLGWSKQNIIESRLLHTQYRDGLFINKKDVYDKSDIYFCLDKEVISELNRQKDAVEYCKLIEEAVIQKRILGVSLKCPSGQSLQCDYDLPGYNMNSFDKNAYVEYHYTNVAKGKNINTVNLRFKGLYFDDPENYPILEVRSAGAESYAIQWKFNNSKAWAGRGKEAFKYVIGDKVYSLVIAEAKANNYIKCANIILRGLGLDINIDSTPTQDQQFKINNDEIKNNLINFINISIGFNGRNLKGERITAPYVKVF